MLSTENVDNIGIKKHHNRGMLIKAPVGGGGGPITCPTSGVFCFFKSAGEDSGNDCASVEVAGGRVHTM